MTHGLAIAYTEPPAAARRACASSRGREAMLSRQQVLHETTRRLTSLSTALLLPAVHTIQHTCWTRGQFQFHLAACGSRNSIPMLDRNPMSSTSTSFSIRCSASADAFSREIIVLPTQTCYSIGPPISHARACYLPLGSWHTVRARCSHAYPQQRHTCIRQWQ
jgi:hypothetical protein